MLHSLGNMPTHEMKIITNFEWNEVTDVATKNELTEKHAEINELKNMFMILTLFILFASLDAACFTTVKCDPDIEIDFRYIKYYSKAYTRHLIFILF